MYKTVIGLEIHTELKTNSKIFSPSKNEYSLDSNVFVSPLDIALPGTLPFFNEEVLVKAIKLCKLLNMNIAAKIIFDRKNYYYTDLPKGYQITQNTLPIGLHGYYEMLDGKKVGIQDIHIEEDTANQTHYNDCTLINYNRSGVPLIEIVTDPDFNDKHEVLNFLEDLRLILRLSGLSEADATKGQVRCDVNVSVMKENATEFGTKVEIKNINTFNNIPKAIEVESQRQIKLLEEGQVVKQETRRYDEENNTTIFMRSKEDAVDYRYFVEPNIPIFPLKQELVDSVTDIIELPNTLLKKYRDDYNVNIEEAKKIIKNPDLTSFYNECLKLNKSYSKDITNLITGVITEYLNKSEVNIKQYVIKPKDLIELIKLKEENKISMNQVQEVLRNINEEQIGLKEYIEKHNLKQISDEGELRKIIEKIFKENEKEVILHKEGKKNLTGFFVGQVMKETNGKCNPQITNKLINEMLGGK